MQRISNFVSNTKDLLESGRLDNLYGSFNWEQKNWNRSTERSWKAQRKTQWKGGFGRVTISDLPLRDFHKEVCEKYCKAKNCTIDPESESCSWYDD